MLKIFRNFRRNLLSENKSSKYALYAIGEIFLVVVGILIALQINNWNEEKKLKTEEHLLLTNLSLSFERKLLELEDKNAGRAKNMQSILILLDIISAKNVSIPDEDIYGYLKELFIWYAVNEEFSIIDMLYSSGKINTISNDLLKTKLIEWPDKMEEMLEEQRVLQELVVKELNPLIRSHVSPVNTFNRLRNNENSKANLIYSPFPNDFDGLFSDRQFESLISEKLIYLNTNVNDTEILITDANKILKLIRQDLKR